MTETAKERRRISFTQAIFLGIVLGVLTGLFLGEYAAYLKIIGDVFIKLLQMTVLPYIVFALITGIGQMDAKQAKEMAVRGGMLLLLLWLLTIVVVLALPFTFPESQDAFFFRASLVEIPAAKNMLDLYIPSNVFRALVQADVPGIVLFSVAVGVALLNMEKKEALLAPLSLLTDSVMKVNLMVAKLTPIGLFAIAANAAGTMTSAELGRMQVYLLSYIAAAVILGFGIMPMLLSVFTPFRYRDVYKFCGNALMTAFAASNIMIVLPMISHGCKEILEKNNIHEERAVSNIDVILPILFNVPSVGKLLGMLFVLFAAWNTGNPISIADYPSFSILGLLSLFGSVHIALPFLLDALHIPSDTYQLYLIGSVITSPFAAYIGGVFLIVIGLITSYGLSEPFKVPWLKLQRFAIQSAVVLSIVLVGLATFNHAFLTEKYTKDRAFSQMKRLLPGAEEIVHSKRLDTENYPKAKPSTKTLERIRKNKEIRVGYHIELPFVFFNIDKELVGYDVEMMHMLAKDLGYKLRFIPVARHKTQEMINSEQVDIIISSLAKTAPRLQNLGFSRSTMNLTVAFVMEDHLRHKFTSSSKLHKIKNLRVGVIDVPYFVRTLKLILPFCEVVPIKNYREFFNNKDLKLDVLATGAEIGAAWTLWYPEYDVVVPKPQMLRVPLGYAIKRGDLEFSKFLNDWLELKEGNPALERLYSHWVLGKAAEVKTPRWSIMQNVLGWGN